MQLITINASNIDEEHICCAIGNDKANKARAQTKKDWLKARFAEGLVFKRLDQRGKVLIEYMPIENTWKPIIGRNFMVIHCLWVSGQFKGKGYSTMLLSECINDAKAHNMDGIAVVSSNKVKPFLTDKKFYMKHGFDVVDMAPPYFELLAVKFTPTTDPQFLEYAKNGLCANNDGFTFIYSHQCPFMEEYVSLLQATTLEMGFKSHIIKLESHQEAQSIGSPFGTLGIYYNGKIVAHELMTKEKFKRFVEKII